MTRRRATLAALVAAALVAAPAGAEGAPLAKRVQNAVKPLGRGAAVQVTDLSTGRRVVALLSGRNVASETLLGVVGLDREEDET